jgi:hypothetical protein
VDYTWINSQSISLNVAPAVGAGIVERRRNTPKGALMVTFQDGSTVTADDLNLGDTQQIYVDQETADTLADTLRPDGFLNWDGQGRRGTNFADPSEPLDLVNKRYLDSIPNSASNAVAALQTASSLDAGALGGFEFFPVTRGAGTLLQTTLTKIASWITQVFTGFTNSGVGAIARSIQARFRDTLHVTDFGAKGDGVTDDTAAVQAALNACNSWKALLFPAGTYKITGQLVASGMIAIQGHGMSATRLVFSGNSNLRINSGPIITGPGNQVFIAGISLQSDDTLNTSTALLDIRFPSGGNGSTARGVQLTDVEVCGTSLAKGFMGGINLFNATTFKTARLRITNSNTGAGGFTAGSFGLKCDTDSQAGDWYIDQAAIYFCDNAVYGVGEGANAGFEGLTLTECLLVANNVGLNVASVTSHLYVRASGCNFNCVTKCISLQNMLWIDITDNIFYAYDTGVTVASWIGVSLLMNDTPHGLNSTNMIRGNVFTGFTTSHATSRNGIVFQTNPNLLDSQTLIDANSFSNLEGGLVLFSGANNVTFTNTNSMANVGTAVQDSSGQSSNKLAYASIGVSGGERSNTGVERKWGVTSTTLDAGGRGYVNFPVAFKSALLVAFAQNSFAGSGNNLPVTVDLANSTKSQLVFYVQGGSAGLNYQVAWEAIGN